jgi:hypothetical protein
MLHGLVNVLLLLPLRPFKRILMMVMGRTKDKDKGMDNSNKGKKGGKEAWRRPWFRKDVREFYVGAGTRGGRIREAGVWDDVLACIRRNSQQQSNSKIN